MENSLEDREELIEEFDVDEVVFIDNEEGEGGEQCFPNEKKPFKQVQTL